jgi:hypothetical protein
MNNLIPNKAFYVGTSMVYPPFKNGFYLEEYFLHNAITNNFFRAVRGLFMGQMDCHGFQNTHQKVMCI